MLFNIGKAWWIITLYSIAVSDVPLQCCLQTFLLLLQGRVLNGGQGKQKDDQYGREEQIWNPQKRQGYSFFLCKPVV